MCVCVCVCEGVGVGGCVLINGKSVAANKGPDVIHEYINIYLGS